VRSSQFSIVVVTAAAGFLVAACSSSGPVATASSTSQSSTFTSPPEPTVTPTPVAQGGFPLVISDAWGTWASDGSQQDVPQLSYDGTTFVVGIGGDQSPGSWEAYDTAGVDLGTFNRPAAEGTGTGDCGPTFGETASGPVAMWPIREVTPAQGVKLAHTSFFDAAYDLTGTQLWKVKVNTLEGDSEGGTGSDAFWCRAGASLDGTMLYAMAPDPHGNSVGFWVDPGTGQRLTRWNGYAAFGPFMSKQDDPHAWSPKTYLYNRTTGAKLPFADQDIIREIGTMSGGYFGDNGTYRGPASVGGTVLVTVDPVGADLTLRRLNLKTGRYQWATGIPKKTGEGAGQGDRIDQIVWDRADQVVIAHASASSASYLFAVDDTSGKVLWTAPASETCGAQNGTVLVSTVEQWATVDARTGAQLEYGELSGHSCPDTTVDGRFQYAYDGGSQILTISDDVTTIR
jgi:hypothetical protein